MKLKLFILSITLFISNFIFAQKEFIEYYNNGQTLIKGAETNSKPTGIWETFYKNGSLESKGLYKNGNRFQKWSYYYESGKLKCEGNFEGKLQDGEWKFYFEHGQLGKTGLFKNGKQEGEWKYYYGHGSLISIANFVDGKLSGEKISYFTNGTKKIVSHYRIPKSSKAVEPRLIVDLEDDGNKDLENHKNKEWVVYSIEHDESNNNIKDKTWFFFYSNGKIKTIQNYNNGLRDGEWENYSENGILISRKSYQENQLHGKFETYFKTGKIEVEGTYSKGDETGIWNQYEQESDTVFLVEKTIYGESPKDSYWKRYNKDGSLEEKSEYKNGKIVKFEVFYPNGKIGQSTEIISHNKRVENKYRINGTLEGSTMYWGSNIKWTKTYDENGALLKTTENNLSFPPPPPPPPPPRIEE